MDVDDVQDIIKLSKGDIGDTSHPRLSRGFGGLAAQSFMEEDESEEPDFIEVNRLGMGKSFGELALIQNKPRAAGIRCLTQCHFAVMSKGYYQKMLSRIELKA